MLQRRPVLGTRNTATSTGQIRSPRRSEGNLTDAEQHSTYDARAS